jgi:hypothetical protein
MERIAGDHPESMAYRIDGNLLMVSDTPENLASLAAGLGSGAASAFASELRSRYQRGVSWLFAVNVAAFAPQFQQEPETRLMGLQNMSYVFFEQGR